MQHVPGWLPLREHGEGQSEESCVRYRDVERVAITVGRSEQEIVVLVQALGRVYCHSRHENKREADSAAQQILKDIEDFK
ncbi:hypothetical protein J7E62_29660 [Variovorax paradoxus]|nr:hypothetical protein [Variovorax paradoxus]